MTLAPLLGHAIFMMELGALPLTLQAQYAVLAGKVIDQGSGAPIAGVAVSAPGSHATVQSDSSGRFMLLFPASVHTAVTLTKLGYRPLNQLIQIAARDTAHISFSLIASTQTLDTVKVVTDAPSMAPRLAGFEARRARAVGTARFITREEIAARNPTTVTDMLRGMASIRVIDSAGIKLIASGRGYRAKTLTSKGGSLPFEDFVPCYLAIGVDGQMKEFGFSPDWIDPHDVHGIEIYAGPATMPRELMSMGLSSDRFCGLLMIWTRVDR